MLFQETTILDLIISVTWASLSGSDYLNPQFRCMSQFQAILRVINDDRSICKNRSRSKNGDDDALQSLHPQDHCLLDNPQGAAFDERPTPRVPKKEGETSFGVNS